MKNIYHFISISVFFLSLIFFYIVAELDDSPGLILIGGGFSFVFNLIVFELGTVIENQKNILKALKKDL